MRKIVLLTALLASSAASAADLKAPAPSGYPYTSCGVYFGIDTAAISGSTSQGEIGGVVGYSCPLGAQAFWFVEGMFNYTNLSTTNNGLALTGPVSLEQRIALGSPLSNLLGLFPSLNLQVPTLPLLPTGVTVTTAHPYMFGAFHEQDISASVGLSSNKAWEFSPGFGVGVINQLSNGVALDVFTEAQFQTQAYCVGVQCTTKSTLLRVGMALKY
jgi:hypothetical protein